MAAYLDLTTLAQDGNFVKRITYAVAKFASYILDESEAAPNHKIRARWAQSAILNPAGVAAAIAPAVCLDATVVADLVDVTDAQLQTAVENTCAKLLFT